MIYPLTPDEAAGVVLEKSVAEALWQALTLIDSIDFVAEDLGSETCESAIRARAILACTARIRAFCDPFMPAIEAAQAQAD